MLFGFDRSLDLARAGDAQLLRQVEVVRLGQRQIPAVLAVCAEDRIGGVRYDFPCPPGEVIRFKAQGRSRDFRGRCGCRAAGHVRRGPRGGRSGGRVGGGQVIQKLVADLHERPQVAMLASLSRVAAVVMRDAQRPAGRAAVDQLEQFLFRGTGICRPKKNAIVRRMLTPASNAVNSGARLAGARLADYGRCSPASACSAPRRRRCRGLRRRAPRSAAG